MFSFLTKCFHPQAPTTGLSLGHFLEPCVSREQMRSTLGGGEWMGHGWTMSDRWARGQMCILEETKRVQVIRGNEWVRAQGCQRG